MPEQKTKEAPKRSSLGKKVDRSATLLMICIGILIPILVFTMIVYNNSTATRGYDLRQLQRERAYLLRRQEELKKRRADEQSLSALESDEQYQGMRAITDPQYVRDVPIEFR